MQNVVCVSTRPLAQARGVGLAFLCERSELRKAGPSSSEVREASLETVHREFWGHNTQLTRHNSRTNLAGQVIILPLAADAIAEIEFRYATLKPYLTA